jgi:peptide/nickel transport system permease protein
MVTALVTVWGVGTIVFIALHLVPGGFAEVYLGAQGAEFPELVERVKAKYGLDKPLVVQYGIWLGNVLQGDLGVSLRDSTPVLSELGRRGRVTLELTILATLFSVSVGVPAGILAALRRGSLVGGGLQVASVLGLSIPNFVLGTLLIYFVSTQQLPIPVSGYIPPSEDLLRHFGSMLLPTLTLGTVTTAIVMRITRSSVLEVLSEPYVTTAYGKGLHARVVMWRHILRNALIPTVTVVAVNVGYLLSGAVIVEILFSLPGMGRYAVQGVLGRDYPIAQGAVMLGAFTFVFSNFVADIIYAYLDPRIRY